MDEFAKYNELFKNSWKSSLSEEKIREVLTTITPETWKLIKLSRNEYCSRVQTLIQTKMDHERYGVPKMRVIQLDDEAWNKMMREQRLEREKERIVEWKQHKKTYNLSRPRSVLDDNKDKITQDLETLKKSLSTLQEAQAKKYVAPSQRRGEPAKNKAETELISKIGFLENELKNIADRIVKEDNDWDYYARVDFQHERFLQSNKAYYGV